MIDDETKRSTFNTSCDDTAVGSNRTHFDIDLGAACVHNSITGGRDRSKLNSGLEKVSGILPGFSPLIQPPNILFGTHWFFSLRAREREDHFIRNPWVARKSPILTNLESTKIEANTNSLKAQNAMKFTTALFMLSTTMSLAKEGSLRKEPQRKLLPTEQTLPPPLPDISTAQIDSSGFVHIEVRATFLSKTVPDKWIRVFDFSNGPCSDNILLTQEPGTFNLRFSVFYGETCNSEYVVLENAIVPGRATTYRLGAGWVDGAPVLHITDNLGLFNIKYVSALPNAVYRNQNLLGRSPWPLATDGVLEGVVDYFKLDLTEYEANYPL